ncbi:MAG: vitamin B12 transporter, partial [Bacteroidia bacterium]
TVDLALIPAFFFDEVTANNLNSSQAGGGTTAGSLSINSTTSDRSSSQMIAIKAGSFGSYFFGAKKRYEIGNIPAKTSVFIQRSENNYHHQPSNFNATQQLERLKHAQFSNLGLMQQLSFKSFQKLPIHLNIWLQNTSREIPATLLEGSSQKYQDDQSVRIQADGLFTLNKLHIRIKAASLHEYLQYDDYKSKLHTTYGSSTNMILLSVGRSFGKKLNVGSNLEGKHFYANSDSFYTQNRLEVSESLHASYRWKKGSMQYAIKAIQYSGFESNPLLNTASCQYDLCKNQMVRISFAQNYRLPTFNNLFWRPGGNPNLEAEFGNQTEVSYSFSKDGFEQGVEVFNNFITNQIRWVPGSKGYFEASQVLDETQWNRGVESHTSFRLKKLVVQLDATYLHSSIKQNSSVFTGSQQIYLPKFIAAAGIRRSFKKFELSYSFSYYGKRRASSTSENDLPSIALHHLEASYRRNRWLVNAELQNLANHFYTILPYQPMPPRNFSLLLQYSIHKKSSE